MENQFWIIQRVNDTAIELNNDKPKKQKCFITNFTISHTDKREFHKEKNDKCNSITMNLSTFFFDVHLHFTCINPAAVQIKSIIYYI